MTRLRLTDRSSLANALPEYEPMQGVNMEKRDRWHARAHAALMLVIGSLATAGCISVNAPDKPIVIELNINIKQEVIYRLAQDAGNTIDKNAEIF